MCLRWLPESLLRKDKRSALVHSQSNTLMTLAEGWESAEFIKASVRAWANVCALGSSRRGGERSPWTREPRHLGFESLWLLACEFTARIPLFFYVMSTHSEREARIWMHFRWPQTCHSAEFTVYLKGNLFREPHEIERELFVVLLQCHYSLDCPKNVLNNPPKSNTEKISCAPTTARRYLWPSHSESE